jgi:hypothetical protein
MRGGLILALATGLWLALGTVAQAQDDAPPPPTGIVIGEVDRCVNNNETPAAGVSVGIAEGSASLVMTDAQGQFIMRLVEGQYTVVASAADGTSAMRYSVVVTSGDALDIGSLDLGMGIGGCGDDAVVVVAPQATATPIATLAPTPVPPTATPVPPPTATPIAPTPQPDDTTADG